MNRDGIRLHTEVGESSQEIVLGVTVDEASAAIGIFEGNRTKVDFLTQGLQRGHTKDRIVKTRNDISFRHPDHSANDENFQVRCKAANEGTP